ncbi:MAG: hypothetical protein KAI61_03075 [Alphaproteobacteria bacterium]|nr:hypothetical protein [Alphaproteobacteria bacterium]
MTVQKNLSCIKAALFIILGLNVVFWSASRDIYSGWEGVPPVPSRNGAVMMTLGDPEFSYRFLALILQNLGNTGRDTVPLKSYDYEKLGRWFFLLHELDPASDHVPMIAAYYFGGTRVPKDVAVVVDYLGVVGQISVGEKWRWLAHAAYLARHRMHDLSLALKLAYKLVKMPDKDNFPQWARQMPAFILKEQGDNEAARQMMENMLVTENVVHPEEINFMKMYLIEQLGADPDYVDRLVRMRKEGP